MAAPQFLFRCNRTGRGRWRRLGRRLCRRREAGHIFQVDPIRRAVRPCPIDGVKFSREHKSTRFIKAVGPELLAIFVNQEWHEVRRVVDNGFVP